MQTEATAHGGRIFLRLAVREVCPDCEGRLPRTHQVLPVSDYCALSCICNFNAGILAHLLEPWVDPVAPKARSARTPDREAMSFYGLTIQPGDGVASNLRPCRGERQVAQVSRAAEEWLGRTRGFSGSVKAKSGLFHHNAGLLPLNVKLGSSIRRNITFGEG